MTPENTNNINKPQNVDQLVARGQDIYSKIQVERNIEGGFLGQYIAIDVESGRDFIGATRDEAVLRGKEALPQAIFFVRRIGGIDTVSRSYPFRPVSKHVHARVL